MKEIHGDKMCSIKEPPLLTTEAKLRRLEDLSQIREAIFHWCRGCDELDQKMMASCMTEDALLSWDPDDATVYHGKQTILNMLMQIVGGPEGGRTQSHYVADQQVWFRTEDCAVVSCHMGSWQIYKVSAKAPLICFGRFEMQAIRDTDGEWRFNSFRFILAGQLGGDRAGEQFDRPWPPQPIV